MDTSLIPIDQTRYTFPLTKSFGNHIDAQINEVGGAGQTCFLDEMGVNRTKNPIKRASTILAQIDAIDAALFENLYRRKRCILQLRYYKILKFILPNFLFGDLLGLKISQIETSIPRSNKLYIAAMIRKENYVRLYSEIEAIIGTITREGIEEQEKRSHIMELFSGAIAGVMERGYVKEGVYLYADELGLMSESELRMEVMGFCLEEIDRDVHVRHFTVADKNEFLIAMADKYGGRNGNYINAGNSSV